MLLPSSLLSSSLRDHIPSMLMTSVERPMPQRWEQERSMTERDGAKESTYGESSVGRAYESQRDDLDLSRTRVHLGTICPYLYNRLTGTKSLKNQGNRPGKASQRARHQRAFPAHAAHACSSFFRSFFLLLFFFFAVSYRTVRQLKKRNQFRFVSFFTSDQFSSNF